MSPETAADLERLQLHPVTRLPDPTAKRRLQTRWRSGGEAWWVHLQLRNGKEIKSAGVSHVGEDNVRVEDEDRVVHDVLYVEIVKLVIEGE